VLRIVLGVSDGFRCGEDAGEEEGGEEDESVHDGRSVCVCKKDGVRRVILVARLQLELD